MSKSIIRGLWVVMVVAIAAGAYVFGQWTERRGAAAIYMTLLLTYPFHARMSILLP